MLELIFREKKIIKKNQTHALLLYLRVRWTDLGQGQKKVMNNVVLCCNVVMKEQREFKSVSLSPENECSKPYRQHISMADPG